MCWHALMNALFEDASQVLFEAGSCVVGPEQTKTLPIHTHFNAAQFQNGC
jgi:hypothetical protein